MDLEASLRKNEFIATEYENKGNDYRKQWRKAFLNLQLLMYMIAWYMPACKPL